MATTNHEHVGRALDLLRQSLAPFVHRAVKAAVRTGAVRLYDIQRWILAQHLGNKPICAWDVAALLKLMCDWWNQVFRRHLGFAERGLVSELREWRNKWAHQERFGDDDAYRAVDSAERLLKAIRAPQAAAVAVIKRELRRRECPDRIEPPYKTKPCSQADRIRHHALHRYVEPWRSSGQERLSIRAGDVHKQLHLRGAAPNVCSALQGRKFLALANVKLVGHTEPCPSTTTVFYYERA